jgi:cell division protein YceG involved in septum cleavage
LPLKMDSTVNYASDRGTVHTGQDDSRIESPYNSYQRRGPAADADRQSRRGGDARRSAASPRAAVR